MAKAALSLSKTPASHGAVAAMAVQSCQVDEAVFVNALAKGIGHNDDRAVQSTVSDTINPHAGGSSRPFRKSASLGARL
jgi:hypothetical protein